VHVRRRDAFKLGGVHGAVAMKTLLFLATALIGCTATVAPARTSEPTRGGGGGTGTPPAATSVGGFSLEITTSRYGLVAAQTAPAARCTASARLPSGRDSTAQGLNVETTADASGRVSWSYRTVSNTTPGTGTHTVRCAYQGQTKSTSASFRV